MAKTLQEFIRNSLFLAGYAFVAGLLSLGILLFNGPEVVVILLIVPILFASGYYIFSGINQLRAVQDYQQDVDEDIKAVRSQHQTVLDRMTQGVILTDLSDTVEYINAYASKLTGFSLDDLKGKRIYESLLTADERENMRRRTRETATGKNNNYDLQIQRKNGNTAWLRVNSAPMRDDSGAVLGAIHNLTDITEQKSALDALATSHGHLRAILNNIPLVLFMVDTDGVFTLSEGLGLNALQLSSGEVVGKTIFDVYGDFPQIINDYQRALQGDSFQTVVDFGGLIFETFYSPLSDEDGAVTGIIGVAIDVTQRTAVEKDLRLRTQAIEYSATGITIADATKPDIPIIYANQAMLEITGFALAEVLGRNCRFLQGDDRDQPELDVIRQAIRENKPCKTIVRNYRKNGEMFYNELSITPVENEHGEVTHFAGVMNDVTERINAQETLSEARDQALEASRLKSEFLATMSHEIRTPMNGIIGMTELLMDSDLHGEQQEFAKIVFDEAHNLLNIINTILDFSRIEANKLLIHEEVTNLHDIVDGIGEAFASNARAKSLPLYIELMPEVPVYILGDALRLRQIITNLVDNALKFTHEGEVVLRVDAQHNADDTVLIQIKVSDTGIGLEQDGLDRLFEPFTQADGSTTRKYGGTGLGLTISKRLTELMGGQISVESEIGVGSTFSLDIPFKLPDSSEGLGGASSQGKLNEKALNSLHVLVMTSSKTQAEILQRHLADRGVGHQKTVYSMPDVMDELKHNTPSDTPYNVVIVDTLPANVADSAFMLAHDTLINTTGLAVIVLSDVSTNVFRTLAASVDTLQVVNKPFKQAQLYRALLSIADRAPSASHIPESTPAPITPKTLKRVLVVEDNPLNREVTERQLEHLGYSAASAENGKDALDVLGRDRNFDLILMDCQMPEMDGFEATRQIRKGEKAQGNGTHLTIVAMTANAMKGDREKCISAGMDDYISKPVKIDVLRGVLEKWIIAPSD
ncbi:MAG: PAS domain S-box protein [Aggregatilineales bacterium]